MNKLNFLLPVQVGAPDYFKYLNKLYLYFNSNDNNNNYNNIDSSFPQVKHYYPSLAFGAPRNPLNNTTKYTIGPYLAGLFEGDGHIILSKVINSKGKISYPYIAVTFVNKDLPLVNKFIELLKYLKDKNITNKYSFLLNNIFYDSILALTLLLAL